MSSYAEHQCFSKLSASALNRQDVRVYTSAKGKLGAVLRLIQHLNQITNLAEVNFLVNLENVGYVLKGIPAWPQILTLSSLPCHNIT